MTCKRAGNIVNYSYQGSTKGYTTGDFSRLSSCSKLEQCYKEEHSESWL